ncbi:MAG: response regulator [Lachnospiraceae bacterium]|nr:response regulator [Lachnospiraceae bacterium]
MKTIFIVDDNDVNLLSAEEALSDDYRVFTLPSAADMFSFLEKVKPDLILLDIEMPAMNGFEALQKLKEDERFSDIFVIFLTSRKDTTAEVRGFELGAVDFIHKPFTKPILLNRIKTHLEIEAIINEQTSELRALRNSTVSALARVVENRDDFTGNHIERTAMFMEILLKAMLRLGVYADTISKWDMDAVILASRLHDVGKVTISDLILNKPGKLTIEEFEAMKKHTLEGERIINEIIVDSGYQDLLHHAKLFAGFHHERFDGSGYPHGKKGEDIPLQGRVMAIVDVYDALISERPYKGAFSHDKALDIIIESKGSHFDPKIVNVFLEVSDLFAEVEP